MQQGPSITDTELYYIHDTCRLPLDHFGIFRACFRVKYLLQPTSGLRPVPPRRFSCQSLPMSLRVPMVLMASTDRKLRLIPTKTMNKPKRYRIICIVLSNVLLKSVFRPCYGIYSCQIGWCLFKRENQWNKHFQNDTPTVHTNPQIKQKPLVLHPDASSHCFSTISAKLWKCTFLILDCLP